MSDIIVFSVLSVILIALGWFGHGVFNSSQTLVLECESVEYQDAYPVQSQDLFVFVYSPDRSIEVEL